MNSIAANLIAVVDVETTGLSPWRNHRIVEIAVIIMSADGSIQHEYETLVNPDRDLGPTRIHRITAAEILGAPKFSEIAGDIAALLGNADILAGHNVSFDKNFLIEEYQRLAIPMPDIPVLCTCQLLGRNNLTACCKEWDVVFDGEPHRALSDARATARLLEKLIAEDQSILEGFPKFRKKWPEILPLGTLTVSRDAARERLQDPPSYLQRITSKSHHDTNSSIPNVLSYLALVDRVLEDRVIDKDEESALVDAVGKWGLSRKQVTEAHQTYIHNLAVHAVADGIVTNAERSDLHNVARLLGYDVGELDHILDQAAAQLNSINPGRATRPTSKIDLGGKRICFTGQLQSTVNGQPITRALAETLAEQAGLIVANTVTKKLDYLVVADPNTQSGKAKKAREYGTRIFADSVFWKMIGVAVE